MQSGDKCSVAERYKIEHSQIKVEGTKCTIWFENKTN